MTNHNALAAITLSFALACHGSSAAPSSADASVDSGDPCTYGDKRQCACDSSHSGSQDCSPAGHYEGCECDYSFHPGVTGDGGPIVDSATNDVAAETGADAGPFGPTIADILWTDCDPSVVPCPSVVDQPDGGIVGLGCSSTHSRSGYPDAFGKCIFSCSTSPATPPLAPTDNSALASACFAAGGTCAPVFYPAIYDTCVKY